LQIDWEDLLTLLLGSGFVLSIITMLYNWQQAKIANKIQERREANTPSGCSATTASPEPAPNVLSAKAAPSTQKLVQKNGDASLVYPLVCDIKSHILASWHSRYIMGFIPINYFFTLGKPRRQMYGALICIGLSLVSALFVYLLLEV
jgi:hypothetical protein